MVSRNFKVLVLNLEFFKFRGIQVLGYIQTHHRSVFVVFFDQFCTFLGTKRRKLEKANALWERKGDVVVALALTLESVVHLKCFVDEVLTFIGTVKRYILILASLANFLNHVLECGSHCPTFLVGALSTFHWRP